MSESYIGFIDVGFLKGAGASLLGRRKRDLHIDAAALVTWLKSLDVAQIEQDVFLRAYWYDGAFEPDHAESPTQRAYHDAIEEKRRFSMRLPLPFGLIAHVERKEPAREPDQPVRLPGHRGGHDDEVVALPGEAGDPLGDLADALGAAHGGAAVLLDDQGHG